MTKRYEELTIADDFMFGKVMEDKGLCRKVLECLMEKPVGRLEDVQTEKNQMEERRRTQENLNEYKRMLRMRQG